MTVPDIHVSYRPYDFASPVFQKYKPTVNVCWLHNKNYRSLNLMRKFSEDFRIGEYLLIDITIQVYIVLYEMKVYKDY